MSLGWFFKVQHGILGCASLLGDPYLNSTTILFDSGYNLLFCNPCVHYACRLKLSLKLLLFGQSLKRIKGLLMLPNLVLNLNVINFHSVVLQALYHSCLKQFVFCN